MSAKTKDERINEVADQLFDLLKEFVGKHVPGTTLETNGILATECKCESCRAYKLIKWIEAGWDDDSDKEIRRAMDPSDEELGLEGEELTADNLTPEGMGPDDKEE